MRQPLSAILSVLFFVSFRVGAFRQQSNGGTGSDAVAALREVCFHVLDGADAARRFDADIGPDMRSEQVDVFMRRAGFPEAGRGLDEVGAAFGDGAAGGDLG